MIVCFKSEEHKWLSNFYPCLIILSGTGYSSVEHAYMSAKIPDPKWKDLCRITSSAGAIKKMSKHIKLVENWDSLKLVVMKDCLSQKFSQEPFRTKLIETGNQNIQEGNYWGDRFWGVDLKVNPNVGENHLGRLIMEIRSSL